jgi:ubiquinol-cytochrome c reductase cytochrome c1 subunit
MPIRPSERKELTEMFRKIAISAFSALALITGAASAAEEGHTTDVAFSFEGPFGTFDEHQLQRGLQVYTEVCAACHGLKFVDFRSLGEPAGVNWPEEQVKAYAAAFPINDEAANPQYLDPATGAMRALKPSDKFPANASANAPDLSVMAKARAGFHGPMGLGMNQLFKGMGGPEHIYSVLTGYTGEEKDVAGTVFYENHAFPGGYIGMPPPLSAGLVTYADGTEGSVENYSEDVAAFLTWAAEPKMMVRKESGFKAVLILGLLSVLLYLTNKRIWAGVKGKKLH